MIQKKLLKLAKMMSRFTLDDILFTLEIDEQTATLNINKFEDLGIIKRISETEFLYSSDKKNTKKQEAGFDLSKVTPSSLDITKDKDYHLYLSAPRGVKKKADKYLKVLESSGGLTGKKLRFFIEQWNTQFPDMKTSFASVMRARKRLLYEGLASLLANYHNYSTKVKSKVGSDLYQYFKEFYLTYNAIPMTEAIRLATKKFLEQNPDIVWYSPPSYLCFQRRILSEFTREEIGQFRRLKIEGVKQN